MFQSPVTRELESMGVPFRVFRHPGPVHSLEQAARERGQHPDQVIRSLLFRLSQGEFVLVLIAGRRQVDWRTLREHLGQSRLTTASEEEVLEATGYRLGAVSPFGLPSPIRLLVDNSVFSQTGDVSIGSGVPGTTIILQAGDMRRALGEVEVGGFARGEGLS